MLGRIEAVLTGFPQPPPAAVVIRRGPPVRRIELLAMLAVIALADLGLYTSAGGVGLALMLAGIPVVLVLAGRERIWSPRLVVVSGMLALIAARCAWHSSAGTTAFGIALLLPFAVALRTARSFVPELISSALSSAGGALRQFGGFCRATLRLWPRRRGAGRSWAPLVVPAALVALFGAIFAAANPVIQGWLDRAIDVVGGWVSALGWVPEPVRWVFWIGCAIAAAGLIRPALRSVGWIDRWLGAAHIDEPGDAVPAASRVALARNGMIALNVLFLGYNALDAVYLWAGEAPPHTNPTEYAHAGTVWLSVAFVVSTIVLGALFRGPIAHDARGRTARLLAYAWAAQNLILAAGTFRRIQMYIAYSGLTELRIVGILGASLATLGLAIVVYKLARRRTMLWVMRRQLDALAIAVAAFLIAPTDAIAMRYNVARVMAGQYRPLLHLYKQPIRAEAVPALLRLLEHPDPVVSRGAVVLIDLQAWQLEFDGRRESWPDIELARHRARRAIDDAVPELKRLAPDGHRAAWEALRALAYRVNAEPEPELTADPFLAPTDDDDELWRRHHDSTPVRLR